MYIHIGGDTMVRLREIIGIFDVRVQESLDWPAFYTHRGTRDSVVVVQPAEGDVKSLVLTDTHLYLTPISSLTLKRRAAWMGRDKDPLTGLQKGPLGSSTDDSIQQNGSTQ